MKKINLLTAMALIAATLFTDSVSARILRVNYQSNYNGTTLFGENYGGIPLNPVYTTLTQATGAATATDTIYVEGSPSGISYAGITLTKPLVIIGTGYFLQSNPNTSTDNLESQLAYITFGAGSSGSQIIGFKMTAIGGISVNTSNITIKRCYFTYGDISLTNNIQDIFILQNYFSVTSSNSSIGFNIGGGVTQLYINNNIFKSPLLVAYGNNTYTATQCRNNIFDFVQTGATPTIRMDCNDFTNNIVKDPSITLNINSGNPVQVTYNTGASNTQFDLTPVYNNHFVPVMSTLFVSTGSSDGIYQLLPPSGTAPNYVGDDTADRGAFGGIVPEFRYTLSGLAAIPVIYDVYTTGIATPQNGLPVTIKARTIK